MHLRRVLGNLLVLTAFLAPQDAWADRVVLAPLIPVKGVDSEELANLFALFSSELEFMAGVDEIIEVEPRPPSLTTRCLASSRCIGEIVRENGGETALVGTVEALGSDYILDLSYYQDGRIVRNKTYTVPQAPTPLVNAITPVLAEVVTGVSPVQEKKEAEMVGVSFDEGGDDFDFSGGPTPAPEPEPSYGARSRDERIVAPPPPEPEPEPVDDFDPDAFELGVGSPDEISFGSVSEEEIQSAPPPRREPEPSYVDPYEERDEYYDERDGYYEEPRRVDLDEPDDRGRAPSRSTASKTKKAAPAGFEYRRVYLTAKGGLSRYGIFTFGTAGAEIGVRVTGGLTIAVGAQAYIVRRLVDREGTVQTNFIFPINAGLLYRIKDGRFQPYAGIDVVFSQLLRDATTGQNFFAFGGRARLGFDYFFIPQVGLNVDIGLGLLAGDKWADVDSRLPTLGFYPTGTVGFTFAF